jgi:putative endonuclease
VGFYPGAWRGESHPLRMFYVYILKLNNGQLYTGSTGDLKRRMREHKSKKVLATSNLQPCLLVHYEAYLKESDARRREKFLKRSEGKKLLKKQIKDLLNEIFLKEKSS